MFVYLLVGMKPSKARIHAAINTQLQKYTKTQRRGGQKANYSVKGGFSDENPPFCRFILGILGFAKEQEVAVDFLQNRKLNPLNKLNAEK